MSLDLEFAATSTHALYSSYWSDSLFAHNFTSDAIKGSGAFDTWGNESLAELTTKGASYQNVLQYVFYVASPGTHFVLSG